MSKPTELNIVFQPVDGSPDKLFVDVHDQDQKSVCVGTWSADGDWEQLTITPSDFAPVTMSEAVLSAQWSAFSEVLEYINTLEEKTVPKKDIYAAVMGMRPKPAVWTVPPPNERPDGYQCLLWHRGRWRHMAWVKQHNFWMFGYGSAGILDTETRRYAPLPDEMDGDFWEGDPS